MFYCSIAVVDFDDLTCIRNEKYTIWCKNIVFIECFDWLTGVSEIVISAW